MGDVPNVKDTFTSKFPWPTITVEGDIAWWDEGGSVDVLWQDVDDGGHALVPVSAVSERIRWCSIGNQTPSLGLSSEMDRCEGWWDHEDECDWSWRWLLDPEDTDAENH